LTAVSSDHLRAKEAGMGHLVGASLAVVTLLMISTASAQTANDKIGQVSFPICK
jgi:hypothetical protein